MPLADLNDDERKILKAICDDHTITARGMAYLLKSKEGTIRSKLTKIYNKLDITGEDRHKRQLLIEKYCRDSDEEPTGKEIQINTKKKLVVPVIIILLITVLAIPAITFLPKNPHSTNDSYPTLTTSTKFISTFTPSSTPIYTKIAPTSSPATEVEPTVFTLTSTPTAIILPTATQMFSITPTAYPHDCFKVGIWEFDSGWIVPLPTPSTNRPDCYNADIWRFYASDGIRISRESPETELRGLRYPLPHQDLSIQVLITITDLERIY